jgi:hypothetical protein
MDQKTSQPKLRFHSREGEELVPWNRTEGQRRRTKGERKVTFHGILSLSV